MTNWRHNIELNGAIERVSEEHDLTCVEEPCPEEVREALAAECEKAPPLRHFWQQLREAKSIAEVNRVLDNVFEEADRRLVWCGL